LVVVLVVLMVVLALCSLKEHNKMLRLPFVACSPANAKLSLADMVRQRGEPDYGTNDFSLLGVSKHRLCVGSLSFSSHTTTKISREREKGGCIIYVCWIRAAGWREPVG
jgi:hypothetical protein